MLKHQLTSAQAASAEAQLYSPQKLATRANQSSGGQIMLEEHQTNLEVSSNRYIRLKIDILCCSRKIAGSVK